MPKLKTRTIRLHDVDNVVTAKTTLTAGTLIAEENVVCKDTIPSFHKIATTPIHKGEYVIKYGQVIGAASKEIQPGEHVHTHNIEMPTHKKKYSFGSDRKEMDFIPEQDRAVFQGIIRADGRVATRNYIGIIPTVNCSAGVARFIADAFDKENLSPFPNVDGVLAVVHGSGCGLADRGDGIEILRRTLSGWAQHPNFAGVLLVGLGCEINQVETLADLIPIPKSTLFRTLNIQTLGGTSKTLSAGIEAVREMLEKANQVQRRSVSASHLVIGLECGGSDALSGITANPALGAAGDLVVRHGGTIILSETTEIYGAEQLLARRAVNEDVGQKLIDRIHWWEDYTKRHGMEINNNPSPGNKAGGLTTILEKSLGAVSKSGSTNLMDVYQYAEGISTNGLVFMDTPGYDVVSVTGMIAGGANIICFTTGRGSVFGSKPVPTIKLASNSLMYQNMMDDMDINCGLIMDGKITVEEAGNNVFQKILDSASGRKTKSEILGFGDVEFVPWQMGAVL
ncbi:MAG: altronate dehydratase [Deltaproteobacteria bacterium]|nr:altronate dehydratase [Deltaproteobacteria bacterium]